MNTLNFKQQFTQTVNAKHNIIKLLDKTQGKIFLALGQAKNSYYYIIRTNHKKELKIEFY